MRLVVNEGARFAKRLTWYDDLGATVDMTGWTGRMHVRADIDDDTTVVELTTSNGRMTLGDGTIDLLLTGTETADLSGGVFDILVNDGTDEHFVIAGELIVQTGVTR